MNEINTAAEHRESVMSGRILVMLYGIVVYVFFLGTFLYANGFIMGVPGFKTIDSGLQGPKFLSVIIDLGLLGLFALQHSVMARRSFKRWWTRLVPRAIERSTYVLSATLLLALLMWQWQPLPAQVWTVTGQAAIWTLTAIAVAGWILLLISTFLINHFELFGLHQVYAYCVGRPFTPPPFKTPVLYRVVRHPIYLGFILAFWATPQMSVGHLLFAAATTAYIFVGIYFEERDLIASFGDEYRRYRKYVPMLVPFLRSRQRETGGTNRPKP